MTRREVIYTLIGAISPLVIAGLIAWGTVTAKVDALQAEREHDRVDFGQQLDRIENKLLSIEEHLRVAPIKKAP